MNLFDKHRNPDGTYNGVTAMAEISNIGVDEIRAIAEQVKANHAKLNGCTSHKFEPIPCGPETPMYKQRFRCTVCTGDISKTEHFWHECGRGNRS